MKRRYALAAVARPAPKAGAARTANATRRNPTAPAQSVVPHMPSALGNQAMLQAVSAQGSHRAGVTVSHPGDAQEREADAVAQAFVAGHPAPAMAHAQTAAGVQRQATNGNGAGASARDGTHGTLLNQPALGTVGSSAGQPLAAAARPYERFFGANLSGVRVHDNTAAHRAAGQLDAQAFTVGSDVYFGAGRYQPGSREGQRLMAHELAHVMQGASPTAAMQRAPTVPASPTANDAEDAKLLKRMELLPGVTFLDYAAQTGGLTAWSKRWPKSFEELKKRSAAKHGAAAMDALIAHDAEIFPMVQKSEKLLDRLSKLRDTFAADKEAAHAMISFYGGENLVFGQSTRGLYEVSYSYFAGQYAANPQLDLEIYKTILEGDIDALIADIKAKAEEAQSQDDADAEEKAQWTEDAQALIGTVVAKRDGIFVDDNIELETLLEPTEGSDDADEMVAVARLSGRMAAVMTVGKRFHAFTLDENFERSSIFWAKDWDKYTRIVRAGSGGKAVHTLVAQHGFVITAKGEERFKGGDQADDPMKHLKADSKLLESGRAAALGISPTTLFSSMVRNVALVNLKQAESAMGAIENDVTQEVGNGLARGPDPAKGKALKQDSARLRELTLQAERLAQGIRDGEALTDAQSDQRDLIFNEMGGILHRNPAAAFFVKNSRDEDDKSPIKDDQVSDDLKGKQDGDAANAARTEARKRRENIAKVRRALFDKPELAWGLEPLHPAVMAQFGSNDQLLIKGSMLLRTLADAAGMAGMLAADMVLLIAGLFTAGGTWAALGVHAVGTGVGAYQLNKQLQEAALLDSMSQLDVPGGVQFATEGQAKSARNWAIFGLAVTFLSSVSLIRGAGKLMQSGQRESRLLGRIAQRAGVADEVMAAALRRGLTGVPRPDPDALRQIVLARLPAPLAKRFGNLAIDVLDEERWAAQFGKESAQHAATRFAKDSSGHLYPSVVMFRARGNVLALQEEAMHIVQSADPKFAARVGDLAELGVDAWAKMSRNDRLGKMRSLLELEQDVQRRLAAQARRAGDVEATADAVAEAEEIAQRIAQLDTAIANPSSALPDWYNPNRAPLYLFASPRLPRTGGSWSGMEGNSIWKSTHPDVIAVTGGKGVRFRNGYPDFSEHSVGQVNIGQTGAATDFAEADIRFAEGIAKGSRSPPAGYTKADFMRNGEAIAAGTERYRRAAGLTWHHHQGGSRMLLVPTKLHANVPHTGGASAARAAH